MHCILGNLVFQTPILQKTVRMKNAVIDKMSFQKSKQQGSLNLT